MAFILNIDNAPTVFPSANGLAIYDHVVLRSHNSEWDHVPDLLVKCDFLRVIFISIEWVETDIVVCQLVSNLLFESFPLLESQRVSLGNYRHNVDDFAKFFSVR